MIGSGKTPLSPWQSLPRVICSLPLSSCLLFVLVLRLLLCGPLRFYCVCLLSETCLWLGTCLLGLLLLSSCVVYLTYLSLHLSSFSLVAIIVSLVFFFIWLSFLCHPSSPSLGICTLNLMTVNKQVEVTVPICWVHKTSKVPKKHLTDLNGVICVLQFSV